MPRFRSGLRLRITLPLAIAGLIALACLAVLGLNYASSAASLREMAYRLMSQASDQTFEKTLAHLGQAERLLRLNAAAAKAPLFSIDYARALEQRERVRQLSSLLSLYLEEMRVNHLLASAFLGDEDGNFFMVKRMPDGSLSTQHLVRLDNSASCAAAAVRAEEMVQAGQAQWAARLLAPCVQAVWLHRDPGGSVVRRVKDPLETMDPRTQPWYLAAKAAGGLAWTGVYPVNAEGDPGIAAAVPAYSGDRLLGAFGLDIALKDLSLFLKDLRIGKNGRAFIATTAGELVAYPDTGQLMQGQGESARPNTLDRVSDPAPAAAWAALRAECGTRAGEPLPLAERTTLAFEAGGRRHLAMFAPFPGSYGWPWLVGVVAPEDDFLGDVRQTGLLTAGASAGFTLLAILLGLLMSRRITEPLTALAEEARRIRSFDLDHAADVRSPFREIRRMADSFESMKSGLRSFRKYVPANLVRSLMDSGLEAELGGEKRELTILFSDIAGFTSIAETMDPQALVGLLAEYLEEMSAIVHDHGGTVDKYIGDSVMAFWNAPAEVEGHPAAACRAALAMQAAMDRLRADWSARGLPGFAIRIGLHTATVLVGNIGAASRLNYTAVGDGVNLASRLEGLCKHYGVGCVASATTYQAVSGEVLARCLDRVAVKGKREPLYIYELMLPRAAAAAADLDFATAFEEGLELYFMRRFDAAAETFARLQALRPGDGPCAAFIARCRDFAGRELPEDWDGVFRMEQK
ncbi:MAG: adenylate/guanylate cyclase domain-containing protein [Thermodesulfobacteriota bacterium]